ACVHLFLVAPAAIHSMLNFQNKHGSCSEANTPPPPIQPHPEGQKRRAAEDEPNTCQNPCHTRHATFSIIQSGPERPSPKRTRCGPVRETGSRTQAAHGSWAKRAPSSVCAVRRTKPERKPGTPGWCPSILVQ